MVEIPWEDIENGTATLIYVPAVSVGGAPFDIGRSDPFMRGLMRNGSSAISMMQDPCNVPN